MKIKKPDCERCSHFAVCKYADQAQSIYQKVTAELTDALPADYEIFKLEITCLRKHEPPTSGPGAVFTRG